MEIGFSVAVSNGEQHFVGESLMLPNNALKRALGTHRRAALVTMDLLSMLRSPNVPG
jgi:hypothetical protein